MPEKNVGKTDQLIRYVLGVILIIVAIYLGLNGSLVWAIVAGLVALVSIVTAAMGFCGIYAIFGINTCKIKTE